MIPNIITILKFSTRKDLVRRKDQIDLIVLNLMINHDFAKV